MRFIRACEDIQLANQLTGEAGGTVTWDQGVRTLFADPRFVEEMGVSKSRDLRSGLLGLQPQGEPFPMTDSDWASLCAMLDKPKTFSTDFIYCGEAFFRAFSDAPKEK